jgi:hypothetical protein
MRNRRFDLSRKGFRVAEGGVRHPRLPQELVK